MLSVCINSGVSRLIWALGQRPHKVKKGDL